MSHTNYNRISTDNATAKVEMAANAIETNIDDTIETAANAIETNIDNANEPDIVFGFVANCAKLNVRKSPSIDSKVLLVLNRDDEVIVRGSACDDEWYSVYANEQEGFCMKKDITLDA
jgi:SH3-like domain-containing protein